MTFTTITPSTVVNGDQFPASTYNTIVADINDVNTRVSSLETSSKACQVRRTTDLSYSALSDISWESETFDTDSMWSVANPTYVTINTAGIYAVSFNAYMTCSATLTEAYARILKYPVGGGPVLDTARVYAAGGGISSVGCLVILNTIIVCSVGDRISAQIGLTGGSGYTVKGSTTADSSGQTRMSVVRLGGTT